MLAVRPQMRWRQQPGRSTGIDWSNPLSSGLDFCIVGDLQRDLVSGALTSRSGTTLQAAPAGFWSFGGSSARGFDTAGVTTTDVVNTAYTADRVQRSYLALVRSKTGGGGGLGRVFDKSSNTTYNDTLSANSPSWSYGRIFSGGGSSWTIAPLTLNQTALLVMTYDASLSTNDPIAYLDGIKQTVTNSGRGTGTVAVNSHALLIGNRFDGIRVFDGWVGLVVGWRRILAANEIVALSGNPWQLLAPMSVPRFYVLASANPTITISPSTLPGGAVGVAYSETISASGGTAPYSLTVSSGTLPPGLALSSAGTLTGTPITAGIYSFTIKATDAASNTGTQPYSITNSISPVTISPSSLQAGESNVVYNVTLTASGGIAPYTFAVTSGSLPPGLTLWPTGMLAGPLAIQTGVFAFTIQATDSAGNTGTQTYSFTATQGPPYEPWLTWGVRLQKKLQS